MKLKRNNKKHSHQQKPQEAQVAKVPLRSLQTTQKPQEEQQKKAESEAHPLGRKGPTSEKMTPNEQLLKLVLS